MGHDGGKFVLDTMVKESLSEGEAFELRPVEEKEQVTCILQEHDPSGQVNTFPDQLPGENVAFVDTLSLTNQLRVIGRTQRQLSVTYSLLSKGDICRLAKCRQNALFQSSKHVYTSAPHLSWSVSSEHYVFGMRRILI